MAIVKTDDKHYKAIAYEIDDFYRDGRKYKPGEMGDAVGRLARDSYAGGYSLGKKEGKEQGVQAENDRFWDEMQDNGNRVRYFGAFRNWNSEYIRPKHKVIAVGQQEADYLFQWSSNLKKVEAAYFDLSGVTSRLYATFNACLQLEHIEDIKFPAVAYSNTFYNCVALHTIDKINCNASTTFTSTFTGCSSLVNISFNGVIGQNISFGECPLSKASICGVMEHLSATATGKTVTFKKSAVQKAFETASGANDGDTASEWLALAATRTNWTISLV